MFRVIPSRMPHSSAGVHSVFCVKKKRLLTVHSANSSRQFNKMLSNVPAAMASRLARILFRKLVALIWGDSASGKFR